MSHSYFTTNGQCPECGRNGEICVITRIESDAGKNHWVGTELDVTIDDMQESHDAVRLPSKDEPLRILEKWSCPRCPGWKWVEVVVDGGVITSIEVVRFDRQTFERIHFVTNLIVEFYEDMTGETYYVGQEVRPDWKERLHAVLR